MKRERKLYKIGYLAELLGVTHRTIRYYDQMGLLPHVKRSEGGVRLFDESDIDIIKKIRHMQKEEFLPLDIIKERLFNKNDTETGTFIIVTDSGALLNNTLPSDFPVHSLTLKTSIGETPLSTSKELNAGFIWEKSNKAHILPQFEAPDEEHVVSLYQKLSKKYKKIYSIHTGSTFCNMVETAKKASNKLTSNTEIEIIDSNSIGAGLGLFVEIIGNAIYRNDSLEELTLLIQKQLPMNYQVGFLGNAGQMFVKNKEILESQSILAKFINYKPVFSLSSQNGELNVDFAEPTKEKALERVKELLDAEVISRGRYMNSIIISYSFVYSDAQVLCNELKALYPSISVLLREISGATSMCFGSEVLMVSIN